MSSFRTSDSSLVIMRTSFPSACSPQSSGNCRANPCADYGSFGIRGVGGIHSGAERSATMRGERTASTTNSCATFLKLYNLRVILVNIRGVNKLKAFHLECSSWAYGREAVKPASKQAKMKANRNPSQPGNLPRGECQRNPFLPGSDNAEST